MTLNKISHNAIFLKDADRLHPGAARQWIGLSAGVRARINARLEWFAETGQGDVKRLKGRTGSRLRVGDWRVIFYEQNGTIVVVAVGHRREIYD